MSTATYIRHFSPFEQMLAWYDQHPQEQPFDWYCSWHMLHGFVFATPEFFIMGRPVNKSAPEADICEPTKLFTREESNCWYIHAMAGDPAKAWSILPYPLGWIAFERTRENKRTLQIFEAERIRTLCGLPAT